jgi:anti-sigma regulatory factor (Ser/Thr protein kinase)
MTATDGPREQDTGQLGGLSALVPGLPSRRVFPGDERQLGVLRQWLSSLLPDCPTRDDVLSVATELGSNAIQHTASGQDGGWFAVEITWHEFVVLVAVADCGGAAEPRVIDDPDGDRGRGLLLVQGLSVRTGVTGDQRGRRVWAQIAWDDPSPAACSPSQDPYQAAVRDGEAALARRFAGVPVWFGRSTLAWWAVAGPQGLVSAPTARELAGLLYRLFDTPGPAQFPAAGQAHHTRADERPALHPRRQPGAHSRDAAPWRPSDTVSTGLDGSGHGRPALVPGLMAARATSLTRA